MKNHMRNTELREKLSSFFIKKIRSKEIGLRNGKLFLLLQLPVSSLANQKKIERIIEENIEEIQENRLFVLPNWIDFRQTFKGLADLSMYKLSSPFFLY